MSTAGPRLSVRPLQRNWAGFYYADTADRRGSGYGAKWGFMVATALGQASRLAALGGPGQASRLAGLAAADAEATKR